MSQLLTQCPFCQTTFKVSDAQLQIASGVVRCGSCMEVFLATQHRVILKDRPEEVSRQQSAPEFSANFPATSAHSDTYSETREAGWEVTGDHVNNEDAHTTEEDLVDDPLLAAQDLPTEHGPAFSSWEAEEAFRAANDPEESESEPAEPVSWEDFDEPEPDVDQPGVAKADQETGTAQSAASADQPVYSDRLNPAGYLITSFSVDHVLPRQSAIDAALENNPALWDEPVSDEPVTPDTDDTWHPEGNAGEEADYLPDAIPDGEQFPVQPVATRTAVIVPEKSASIPTLVPDVVASEDIPAAGIGAQTMAWFQSFRKSFTDKSVQAANYAGTDKKAEIRSHLSGLRDEDSLEPVASEALDVFDDDPVELPYMRQQWQNLRTAGMTAASLLLVALIGLQYAWFNLDTLVLEHRLAGVTGVLCKLTTCPDGQLIDLSALVTEELVVRSHPDVEDALQVNFIFRNDRNREQPFPLVELNFTDINGDIVANRVFTSKEYMPGEMQLFTHMPAHSSIQVSLDLVDPGSEATGYSLVFRNP